MEKDTAFASVTGENKVGKNFGKIGGDSPIGTNGCCLHLFQPCDQYVSSGSEGCIMVDISTDSAFGMLVFDMVGLYEGPKLANESLDVREQMCSREEGRMARTTRRRQQAAVPSPFPRPRLIPPDRPRGVKVGLEQPLPRKSRDRKCVAGGEEMWRS